MRPACRRNVKKHKIRYACQMQSVLYHIEIPRVLEQISMGDNHLFSNIRYIYICICIYIYIDWSSQPLLPPLLKSYENIAQSSDRV